MVDKLNLRHCFQVNKGDPIGSMITSGQSLEKSKIEHLLRLKGQEPSNVDVSDVDMSLVESVISGFASVEGDK